MTIAEAAAKYGVTPDTLRYYEKQGLIPRVTRTKSGLRDYKDSDVRWVEFIKCMRAAGVSIEALAEYVRLFQQGKNSIPQRKEILIRQREAIAERIAELTVALNRLDKKLDGYEERMLKYEADFYHSPD